jgi:hypothetical protein
MPNAMMEKQERKPVVGAVNERNRTEFLTFRWNVFIAAQRGDVANSLRNNNFLAR